MDENRFNNCLQILGMMVSNLWDDVVRRVSKFCSNIWDEGFKVQDPCHYPTRFYQTQVCDATSSCGSGIVFACFERPVAVKI